MNRSPPSRQAARGRVVFLACWLIVASLAKAEPERVGVDLRDAPSDATRRLGLPYGARAPSQSSGIAPPILFAATQQDAADLPSGTPGRGTVSDATLAKLVAEALAHNPEITAAARERDAAFHRVRPAGALDDPMLEAGVINVPFPGASFRREDMTMKMLGLSQKLPYPGKRGLREDLAGKEAELIEYGYQETTNRVVRDVRTAYVDLSLVLETTRIVQRNRFVLEQFLKTAEARYAVGLSEILCARGDSMT